MSANALAIASIVGCLAQSCLGQGNHDWRSKPIFCFLRAGEFIPEIVVRARRTAQGRIAVVWGGGFLSSGRGAVVAIAPPPQHTHTRAGVFPPMFVCEVPGCCV
ncbi:MAG TPA: hypothetical protein DDY91_19660 [Planctomycetaceae bacterium]|nr:hypothetical protein [Planctomycetaceae bacterium]